MKLMKAGSKLLMRSISCPPQEDLSASGVPRLRDPSKPLEQFQFSEKQACFSNKNTKTKFLTTYLTVFDSFDPDGANSSILCKTRLNEVAKLFI